jgi:hypothetical protein
MRIFVFIIAISLFFTGCGATEDYREVRAGVVLEHDKVMLDDQKARDNREQLSALLLRMDSLKQVYPDLDTMQEVSVIQHLMGHIDLARKRMDTWMIEFDAELGDRSNNEAVTYFKQEQLKLIELDSLFKEVLKASDDYLNKD